MPEFVNPFSGTVPDRKLTREELIRAIRLNIAAEHEAIHLYESHADATDNELAAAVLHDIANEEREHVGEFQRLLSVLAPDEEDFIATGVEEVNEMIEALEKGASVEEVVAEDDEDEGDDEGTDIPAVGDLKD
jgi:rubrerythrin